MLRGAKSNFTSGGKGEFDSAALTIKKMRGLRRLAFVADFLSASGEWCFTGVN